MKNLPSEYSSLLQSHGRDVKEAGINGVALPKSAAIKAIGILRRTNTIPILGGEVFIVRDGKISLSYDNWDTKSSLGPNSAQYKEAGYLQAEQYITKYADPEDGTVFYRLVTGLEHSPA